MNDYELYHYGVKGMKWGVRRAQKKKYGLSKGQVKKQIRDAKTRYRRDENPYHTFNGTTGKNWASVYSQHRNAIDSDSAIKDAKAKRDQAYSKAVSYDNKGDVEKAERYQDRGDEHQKTIDTRKAEIGKRFSDAYNDALLKDIGYADTQRGREMLAEYGITNDWGKYR